MKRSVILFLFVCISISLHAQVLDSGKNVPFSQDRGKEVFLDGEWRFLFTQGEAEIPDWADPALDDSGWDRVNVPSCWDALGYAEPKYVNPRRATGYYRQDFKVLGKWLRNGRVFLRFDGVLKGYEVWVNGKYAGKWESAFNSCQFDVTDFVSTGRNLLAVKVYTEYKGADFDSNDDWGQAGINRSVTVFPVTDFHVSDITLSTSDVSEGNATLHYDVKVADFGSGRKAGRLRVSVRGPNGRKVFSKRLKVSTGEDTVSGELDLSKPFLWSAETPDLYTLECSTGRKDRQSVRFGVREVKVDGSVLRINGKAVKLRGVNLHDTDPLNGKYISRELLLKDLEMMKQANINFIRTCHYPKAPEFYDLCDELGFYVMDEVPFGFGDSHLYDESYRDILFTRAEATVARDKNHPCIIVWSVGNENPLTPIAEDTGRYVKAADPTRPICYPMVHDYFLSLDYDIPEFVDIYAPHYPPVPTLLHYAETATRPVIATEYCHSLGQSLEQQDELWEIMQSSPNIAGGAIWEWCDQGMPDRNESFPGGFTPSEKLWLKDSTCISMEGNSGTDGILYADRTPLSNYYEVRTNYAQARLVTDTLRAGKGHNDLNLTFENRYDFVDLKDDVVFEWRLKDGRKVLDQSSFTVSCAPGASVGKTLGVELPASPSDRFYSLEVCAVSKKWGTIGEYSIPVVSEDGESAGDLFSLGWIPSGDSGAELPEMFLRAGRKKGLAEVLRAREAVSHYLIRPEWIGPEFSGKVRFTNAEFSAEGTVTASPVGGGAVRIDAAVVPGTERKQLLEAGLAFLMGPDVKYVQWLGQGPYASYPGKMQANVYGMHALQAGDLYFEGNRMGVDMALATDAEGAGWLFLCKGSCMDFEYTDAGLVMTVNDKVSGMCGKLRRTSFPVFSSAEDPIMLSFVMVGIKPGEWPEALSALFADPSGIPLFKPFLTQYDTYCLRLRDILGEE